jgi:inhibitor of KinA
MTLTMPAGWAVIGRSKVDIVRDDPDRPFLFDVGDKIRYRAISKAEFEA